MPDYRYTVRDAAGKKISGSITSDNEMEAKQELRRQDYVIISIEERHKGVAAVSKPLFGRAKGTPRVRIKSKDLTIFTRQLSTMIAAGIPMLESLEVLAEQADDAGFRQVLGAIVEDVRSGTDLSAAMAKHPATFRRLFVNMIKAGEASGQIDDILNRLADYQEANDRLKSEIKSAMTYPMVSITMIVGITLFLLIFVVPQFKTIFDSLNIKKLPLPTELLFMVSEFMRNRAVIWIPGVLLIIVGIVAYSKTGGGGYYRDWLMLKLPVLGPLFQKVAISRFSRTFSTLLQSGVPILATLEIVATTTGNRVIENAVMQASQNIREGEPLATPLSKSGVFPPMVTRMVSIGERSGALETLLEKIADFYDQEVKSTVEQLTSLIEPLMIGVMGFFVGGIVMAVFLPIFGISSQLRG